MAKIAIKKASSPPDVSGGFDAHRIAAGSGWSVDDVVCARGPRDRPFDEQHRHVNIATITAGTFQYRGSAANGREVMVPGAVMLGSPGQCFECGHEHGVGDRCLSFRYTPAYFDAITEGVRGRSGSGAFRSLRLAPVRSLAPAIADACAALAGSRDIAWDELGIRLAAQAVQTEAKTEPDSRSIKTAEIARITGAVRSIDADPTAEHAVLDLARDAKLSPYHFLRMFERVTGTTPHQFVVRARLRSAATALRATPVKIIDIALTSGFDDVSAFNRAFKREFGASPGDYRRREH